ncbi:Uncharacterised protein [Mycobacteroides abscessus subsp. abscessus]|nr:Uncharacterised protein [Mycobacteroides abscessus subsp. abscessus]
MALSSNGCPNGVGTRLAARDKDVLSGQSCHPAPVSPLTRPR